MDSVDEKITYGHQVLYSQNMFSICQMPSKLAQFTKETLPGKGAEELSKKLTADMSGVHSGLFRMPSGTDSSLPCPNT